MDVYLNKLQVIIKVVVFFNIAGMIMGFHGKYSLAHFFYDGLTSLLLILLFLEAKELEKDNRNDNTTDTI